MIRYLFSINTGRSGSNYLQQLFGHVENCDSWHELPPKGHKKPMRAFLAGDDRPMRRVVEAKLEAMERSAKNGKIYVETSHLFIKGFGWLLPEYLPQSEMGVVVLTREPEAIAESWLRKKRFTPLTRGGPDWLIMPNAASPLAPPPMRIFSPSIDYRLLRFAIPKRRFLRRVANSLGMAGTRVARWSERYEWDCLLWYIEEVRRRGEAYQKAFPGVRYHHCSLADLNDRERVEAMFETFGCRPMRTLDESLGRRVNHEPRHARAA